MRNTSLFILSFFSIVSFTPEKKFYCACCAEKGDYSVYSTKFDKEKAALLKEMIFAPAVNLYITNAGFDGMKGLNSIKKSYESWEMSDTAVSSDFFTASNSLTAKSWKFDFKTADAKTGTLNLLLPIKIENFKTDIHDSQAGEVILYKEMRFKGTVQSGTGFFSGGLQKPATYFLVLQGRGNNCDNADDFKNWRLEITGSNASYTFWGTLNINSQTAKTEH